MRTFKKIANKGNQKNNFFHKFCLGIILLCLVGMIRCDKPDENSGKLEVLGKIYTLDYGNYSKSWGDTYGFLEFYSQSFKLFLEVGLINTHWLEVPTGTLKIGNNKSKPGVDAVQFIFNEEQIFGLCDEEATLRIRKSSYNYPRGCDNYNVTLTGKMRFRNDDTLHNFKFTFKGCL